MSLSGSIAASIRATRSTMWLIRSKNSASRASRLVYCD